jgi:hypothetical protein
MTKTLALNFLKSLSRGLLKSLYLGNVVFIAFMQAIIFMLFVCS